MPHQHERIGRGKHLESELEYIPVEVESTVTDAVGDAQLAQTRQMIDNEGQSQVIARYCWLVEVN